MFRFFFLVLLYGSSFFSGVALLSHPHNTTKTSEKQKKEQSDPEAVRLNSSAIQPLSATTTPNSKKFFSQQTGRRTDAPVGARQSR